MSAKSKPVMGTTCNDLAAGALGPFDGGDGLDGQGVCQVSSLQDVPPLCVYPATSEGCSNTKTAPACKPLTAHNACPHLSLLCRERRWKMTHAKRFAGQIKRSNLDVESRQQVRAKEELQALRKQAAFVGKEVGIQAE